MKIISWNVNGIRAILNKGFFEDVKNLHADILCIQETKAHPDQVDTKLTMYEHNSWSSAEKKGYAGTAVFSKIKPLHASEGIGIPEHDKEGRVLTLEFEKFFLVNVYVPNSGRELVRLKYRAQWDNDFLQYLKHLEKKKPVVACGDFNVAHTAKDLANPVSNYNKTAGYTQVEIDGLEQFIASGFVDTFREFHTEGGHYTFWSYMFHARKKNIGWRIDYFLISNTLRPKLKEAFIVDTVMGSDHCPVGITLDV